MTLDELKRHIFQIKDHESFDAKERYLFDTHIDILDALVELSKTDLREYQLQLENLFEAFRGTKNKGLTERNIKRYIENKLSEIVKEKLNSFTKADITQLNPNRNGLIPCTTRNIIEVLLAANGTHVIYDGMSSSIYFTSMDWEPLTAPLEVSGRNYHKYDETNKASIKAVLNKHVFPNEVYFSALDEGLLVVAQHNKTDLYMEYMNNMPIWDGKDRSDWASKYLGATPGAWCNTWGRVFMLSIMHRCYSPGEPLRYYFAIEGKQNIGKTEFCKRLVPDYWHASQSIPTAADSPVEFYRATYDKAIVEIPELGNLNKRNDQDLWKRIVTERNSTFRRMRVDPVSDYPKRNIFIVTTNEYSYLRDDTGDTRLIPIRSNNEQNEFFDLDGFSAELPQIYAQFREMYATGVRPHLTRKELELQKNITEERDYSKETLEYQIIEHYMNEPNGNITNFDVSKQHGMWLDKLYAFLSDDVYRMSRDKAMLKSRLFSKALVKYGFIKLDKPVHIPEVGTKRVFVWPDTEMFKRYSK